MNNIIKEIRRAVSLNCMSAGDDTLVRLAPAIRMALMKKAKSILIHINNTQLGPYLESESNFLSIFDLWKDQPGISGFFRVYYLSQTGEPPAQLDDEINLVAIRGLGVLIWGATAGEACLHRDLFLDLLRIKIRQASGQQPDLQTTAAAIMTEYAEAVPPAGGRLAEKIALVTGAAQGFGRGIAEYLLKVGANVVIADLNTGLARETAREFCSRYGRHKALALGVDVADEDSVRLMIRQTVAAYGGLDIMISNAGILKAGSLEDLSLADFSLSTRINYGGFFLCAKYGSLPMKAQHRVKPDYYMDLIQINSKSGLAGSKKNFAYAGSKFGGIGLTQSFALELVEYNIKVNAICPGNFFAGPLWSDPEKGLFVQYLKAGKVPGARTVGDVRAFYESKVPMGRGCRIEDVARAVDYIIEQQYETGQAIPVTGGQIMLK